MRARAGKLERRQDFYRRADEPAADINALAEMGRLALLAGLQSAR